MEEGALATRLEVREPRDEAKALAWVQQLIECDIRLLCLDFDLTLVSQHTGGKWWGGAETLARNVRPVFKDIVPAALQCGIQVSIVTISRQSKLVADVLRIGFPCDTSGILIRGGQRGRLVTETGEADELIHDGSRKEPHINSILHARHRLGEEHLVASQVLLVDDDLFNVEEALDNGHRAVILDPDSAIDIVNHIPPLGFYSPAKHAIPSTPN